MNSVSASVGGRAPRRSSLTRNVAALYALQIANYLIPLVTLPYLIRVLGAESYGVMALAYAVVFLMVLFVDAGFNTLATRQLAKPDIDIDRISEIYVANQLIKLAQCAAMFVLLCALALFVPKIGEAWPIYLVTFPIVLGSFLFPTWLFQGLEIMHVTTLCSVGGRALATIGIFVFVNDPDDLVSATLLQASATALSGLLSLPLIFGRLHLVVPWHRLVPELRRTLAEARSLAPAEFVTHAIDNSGVFILGLFAGNAAVGIYAAIEKIARAGASLFQPLTKALFPALTGRWISDAPDAADFGRMWTRRILLLASGAALSMYVLAPLGLGVLFGNDWVEHAALLRALAAWLIASVSATVLGQFWLLARGERATYSACLIKATSLQLVAALVGTSIYGTRGLVAAIVIAELARVALFYAAIRGRAHGAARCA